MSAEDDALLANLTAGAGEQFGTGAAAGARLRRMAAESLGNLGGADSPVLVLVVEREPGSEELQLAIGGTTRPSQVPRVLRMIADEYEHRTKARCN